MCFEDTAYVLSSLDVDLSAESDDVEMSGSIL